MHSRTVFLLLSCPISGFRCCRVRSTVPDVALRADVFPHAQRKRAAGESSSESDWSESDDSDDESDEETRAAREKKEAAFTKALRDMMERREQAEPGVLQEVLLCTNSGHLDIHTRAATPIAIICPTLTS